MADQRAGVHVEGLREFVRKLEKLGVEVQDLKAAFKKVGTLVAADAQALVPRRSGALAASIRPSNNKNKSVVRAGGARVPYAGVINYGWPGRGIPASLFLNNAANRNQGKAVLTIEQELDALVKRLDLK